MRPLKKTVFILLLAACAPTVAERGHMVDNAQLQQIMPGTQTKSDVLRILGSPTTESPFDGNIWYYIGQKTEKHGILDPKVVKEKIVTVTFDSDGTVRDISDRSDKPRIDVPVERAETPTKGNDFTFMQQLLGNVGRFNSAGAKTPAGAN